MGMNGFLRAFSQAQIDEMKADHDLIDDYVDNDEFVFESDVETAWDILEHILASAGLAAGTEIDGVLSGAALLLDSHQVKVEAQKLARWTSEEVAAKFGQIDASADLYHLGAYRDDDGESLLEAFKSLTEFYQKAAAAGLGALINFA